MHACAKRMVTKCCCALSPSAPPGQVQVPDCPPRHPPRHPSSHVCRQHWCEAGRHRGDTPYNITPCDATPCDATLCDARTLPYRHDGPHDGPHDAMPEPFPIADVVVSSLTPFDRLSAGAAIPKLPQGASCLPMPSHLIMCMACHGAWGHAMEHGGMPWRFWVQHTPCCVARVQ